jgi:hypothetical protein
VRWPADGGLFHVLQTIPIHYHPFHNDFNELHGFLPNRAIRYKFFLGTWWAHEIGSSISPVEPDRWPALLPRRIFLDSCTAQTLRRYGGYIYEGEPIDAGDRINKITSGIANVEALRAIFQISERALSEWIVSRGSMEEAQAKRDDGHMQWLWDIADHSEACLESDGPTAESEALGERLSEPSSVIELRRSAPDPSM